MGHVIADDASPIDDRCGCGTEENLPHIRTTKYNWRDMVFVDHLNARLLGTCNGRNPREFVPQSKSIEMSMLWDRMDLVAETYPQRENWLTALMGRWLSKRRMTYSELFMSAPQRYVSLFDGKIEWPMNEHGSFVEGVEEEKEDEDAFMDRGQPDLFQACVDVAIAEEEKRKGKGKRKRRPSYEKMRPIPLRIPETPENQCPASSMSSPTLRLTRLSVGVEEPVAPALLLTPKTEGSKSGKKRRTELERLTQRDGFAKKSIAPTGSTRTGSKKNPLNVHDDEKSPPKKWSVPMPATPDECASVCLSESGEWLLNLKESEEYLKTLRREMFNAETAKESYRLWDEIKSLRRHITELKK